MDGTPKLQRKASLSLSTRLNQKRHSASPQSRVKSTTTNGNTRDSNANCESLQRSPSVISVCSDGGIECTPPHKKMIANLDDSLDYSPKVFDNSFSPTCLLSQTLAIDSPEVGWKWSLHSGSAGRGRKSSTIDDNSTRTPDSAYAADSSFVSAGSSSTEVASNLRTRGSDSYQPRIGFDARREDQRKILEQELRRVEMTRAEEKLKERCAKLQEQLKSTGSQKSKVKSSIKKNLELSTVISLNDVQMQDLSKTSTSKNTVVKFQTPEKIDKPEILNDFFNDSDSDCFLLEATQEIESKMESKTQPAFVNYSTNTPKSSVSSECTSMPHASSAPAATTTPPINNSFQTAAVDPSTTNSENKEKRSSFYMKFLEDDCPDDWFVSLDEVILQATQPKKPRTSLQRYKSMPTETATTNVSVTGKDSNDNCIVASKTRSSKRQMASTEDVAPSSSNFSKMKRHSSTHTLSPASTSYRSRRQL